MNQQHGEQGDGGAYVVDYKKSYRADDFTCGRVKIAVEMVAAAMEQAKSDDPYKVALALEGMPRCKSVADIWMRKEDHQVMVPLSIVDDGARWGSGKSERRRREHRVRLPQPRPSPAAGHDPADHLQDAAARGRLMRRDVAAPVRLGVTVAKAIGIRPHLPAQRDVLRAAAVHAVDRADAHLRHDGRAEFRPRELLHARRLFRLQLSGR